MVAQYSQGLRSQRAVPQYEPTPLTQTHEGGLAHQIDDWMRLDRFLVMGSTGGTYYVNERDHTLDNLDVVRRCVALDGLRVIQRIIEISETGRAPKQDPCIAAFALASVDGNEATKRAVYAAFGRILRIPTHQMHFAKFREAVGGGWGTGLRKAYGRLFNDAEPRDLAYDAVKYQTRDGWALWDLLRLARPKPVDAEHDALYRYIKNGSISEGLPADVAGFLLAVAAVKKLANEPREAAKLIAEHRIPREAIPSELLTQSIVWEALLPSMGITALIRNLGNMTKVGLISNGSAAEREIVNRLQTVDILRKGRVHPIAVLAALKIYEQGKGFKGARIWTATRRIVTALNESFYACYGNVDPTGKRIRIALDISSSMIGNTVAGMEFLSARELEAALLLVFLNTEACDLVGFSHNLVDLNGAIKPSTTIQEAMRIMASLPFGGTVCSLPIREAGANGKDFDAFVTMTDNETSDAHNVSEWLNKYRQQTGHRVTHSVLAFTANEVSIGDPNDPDVFNVAGFDAAAPRLIADFIRG